MTIASNDWYEQWKDYIHRVIKQHYSVVEGTVTSRQLDPPSVKVQLQPYDIETGWIRVGTPYAGQGFGFMAIPAEGQAVKVIFDQGDLASATVVTDVYNEIDVPPKLNDIDDVVFVHSSGSKIYFHKSGDVEVSASSTLILNGGTQALARVGDTVTISGTDSQGGAIQATGTVQSGSSTILG